MARFIVRVELRNTKNDPAAYLRLHFAMRAKGFRREFSSNGTLYRLPHAEYVLDADMTVQAVTRLALEIASKVKFNPMILVSKVSLLSFGGLSRARPLILATALKTTPTKPKPKTKQ